MFRSIAGTAGALSLTLLLVGGCSGDSDDEPTTAAPAASTAPVAADGSAAASAGARPAPEASEAASTPRQLPPGVTESQTPPPGIKLPELQVRTGWITGKVTRGGSGPCYGITADDGEAYAVYSAKPAPLEVGTRVKARLTPGKTPRKCGSGTPATLARLLIEG